MESPSNQDRMHIDRLVAQYHQLLEPHNLSFPPGTILIKSGVQRLVYERMFDPNNVWPMPPVGYRIRVLKLLLAILEDSISDPEQDEILDDLIGYWGELIVLPRRSYLEEAQELSYVRYTPPRVEGMPEGSSVITKENRFLILSSGTTGFRTWEAALHLGSYLSTPEGRSLIKGKNVIELGCGIGFLSMYCLKCLGAKSVLATDIEPTLISAIEDCATRNNLDPNRMHATILDWRNNIKDQISDQCHPPFDIGLGADLIYDPDLVSLLVSALKNLFDFGVKSFIMSATLRNHETFNLFLEACEKNSLTTIPIKYESPPSDSQTGLFHKTDVPIKTYIIKPFKE